MRKHVACSDTQCHVRDHCDVCAQDWPCDASKGLDEYQRFYDFVGDCDPALVDAWHFTENARVARERATA